MEGKNIIQIGGILFFIGILLIIISWHLSYPVSLSSIDDLSFYQIYPSLWFGIILSLIGLFCIILYCKNKIILAICASTFPVILYIYSLFYSFISSSDSGTVLGMFQVFQRTGISSNVISYFSFPTYFSLNEIIHQIVGVDEKGVATISFILYGILLGLLLYIFYTNINKENNKIIPSILIIFYFIGMFSFLNYQWAPQTLALIYFFLLITLSTHLFFNPKNIIWKFMIIIIFIPLVFCHSFIPIIFLSFFIIITIKKRYLTDVFLAILSIYLLVTVFYTSTYMYIYIQTFQQSIFEFGKEYQTAVASSFQAPTGIIDQIISFFNRFTVPIIWIIGCIGAAILFLKRKLNFVSVGLGLAGGFYLIAGLFFSVLGLRGFQILFIPITFGFIFYFNKWKKLTIAFIVLILILAVFGPMRSTYDNTHFQTEEEVNACNFLVNEIKDITDPKVAIGAINHGYLTCQYSYFKYKYSLEFAKRPADSLFLYIFNESLHHNHFILYNSNLGKEIIRYEMTKEKLDVTLNAINYNNKIYDCGETYIINGV